MTKEKVETMRTEGLLSHILRFSMQVQVQVSVFADFNLDFNHHIRKATILIEEGSDT